MLPTAHHYIEMASVNLDPITCPLCPTIVLCLLSHNHVNFSMDPGVDGSGSDAFACLSLLEQHIKGTTTDAIE
jgi:hypothetical protein